MSTRLAVAYSPRAYKTVEMTRTLMLPSALALTLAILIALASPADAGHRQRPAGFEPTNTTLACIRGPWHGRSMESGGNYQEPAAAWDADRRAFRGYAGAYQMDADFAKAYSAAIPLVHWELWDTDPSAPPWTWHPMIQDEVARNGIRARGLQPWPTPNRVCPR